MWREHPSVPEYQNQLALSLSHLGDLYKTVGRHAEAITAYQEVGKLLAPLVRQHPYVDLYQNSLAESQNLLGDVYVQARQWAEAQAAFQEARWTIDAVLEASRSKSDKQLRAGEEWVAALHKAGAVAASYKPAR